MYRKPITPLALCSLSALALCAAPVTAQVLPSLLDKTVLTPDARSQAMGGIHLTLLDDAGGAVFNPALIADAGRASFSLQGTARNNIPYWKALDFLDNLNKTADQIRNDPFSVDWNAVGDHLSNLYNIADNILGNIVDGKAITGRVSIAPNVALSYKNVGLVAYGGVAGIGVMTPRTGTGPFDDKRTLAVNAGFVDLLVVGVPYAFRVDKGHMGVTPKYVRADYIGVSFIADASNRSLTGRQYRHVNDGQPDLDLGFRSDRLPVSPNSNLTWQGAAAIRNLLSPRFKLPAEIKKESTIGGDAPPPPDFSFRLSPLIDIGGNVSGTLGKKIPWRTALELHNITGVNGGNLSFHAGGEIVPLRGLAVRAGYDRDRFVYGLGASLGPVRLDAAVGTDYRKLLSVGLTARF